MLNMCIEFRNGNNRVIRLFSYIINIIIIIIIIIIINFQTRLVSFM